MRQFVGNIRALFIVGGLLLFSLKVLIIFLRWSRRRQTAESLLTDTGSSDENKPEVQLLSEQEMESSVRLVLEVPEYLSHGYDECTVEISKDGGLWVDVGIGEYSSQFNVQTRRWKERKSVFYGKAPKGFVKLVRNRWRDLNGEIPQG